MEKQRRRFRIGIRMKSVKLIMGSALKDLVAKVFLDEIPETIAGDNWASLVLDHISGLSNDTFKYARKNAQWLRTLIITYDQCKKDPHNAVSDPAWKVILVTALQNTEVEMLPWTKNGKYSAKNYIFVDCTLSSGDIGHQAKRRRIADKPAAKTAPTFADIGGLL